MTTENSTIVRCLNCDDEHPYGKRVRNIDRMNPFQECPKCGHTVYAENITEDAQPPKEVSLIFSGYAGVLSNGTIVDRRVYREAVPMQGNPSMGIPEPKEVERL